MTVIEHVLSDLKKQRCHWNEFKAAQDMRLSIAEKEIRALFAKTGQPDYSTRGTSQKCLRGRNHG